MMNQTAYCKELFEYLDGIVGEYRVREHEEHLKKMKETNIPKGK